MPQCPHCQTPYEPGQRYCSICGSFLLHPEEGDTFCPQCGVRVSPRQEFCHECNAPLKGEAPAPLKPAAPEKAAALPEAPGPPAAKASQTWLMGLLVGAGVVIILLLILLFTRGFQPPATTPAPKAEAPAPTTAVPAPAPAAPVTGEKAAPISEQDLKEPLTETLSALREAQLNKDITKFMSVYSLTFPELDQKRAGTLKSWEAYDFTNLVYTLDKIQPINQDNVIAWVTWYIDTRNRRTQELASASQTYQVRFAKEMGKWRIRALEEVTP